MPTNPSPHPANSTTSLGLKGIAALHRYCHSIDGNRRFLAERLDWEEVATSSADHELHAKERSVVFQAGGCVVVCSEPLSDRSLAGRFLKRHPEGIGGIIFDVENAAHAFAFLERRGGTPTSDIQVSGEGPHTIKHFSITTPLDDVLFTFVERKNVDIALPLPGFVRQAAPTGGKNTFAFKAWDHITSNFQTMAPMVLWLEHVLGLERYWDIAFHTHQDRAVLDEKAQSAGDEAASAHAEQVRHLEMQKSGHGSGLRSIVMWDPKSGVRFANNEPYRPNFEASQVYIFCEDQRGAGVQHAAILVDDIMTTVPNLRERGVRFAKAPDGYFEHLPAHLASIGVDKIDENLAALKHADILVDGAGPGRYLLQIFMEDAARFEGDLKKSPFFFEIIQRKGDKGFGAGNFRALFEGVELAQKGRTAVAA
jgi:4-hydroxyphenylpyruvate dioxygenase